MKSYLACSVPHVAACAVVIPMGYAMGFEVGCVVSCLMLIFASGVMYLAGQIDTMDEQMRRTNA